MSERDIEQLLRDLQEPIPAEHDSSNLNNYFKNDVYEFWARSKAGSLFRTQIMDIQFLDDGVCVVARVYIGKTFHDGMAFEAFKDSERKANAVNLARENALRNAYDRFGFGWHNLGKYAKIGIKTTDNSTPFSCVKCHKVLSSEDVARVRSRLKNQKITQTYCEQCVPASFLKNY